MQNALLDCFNSNFVILIIFNLSFDRSVFKGAFNDMAAIELNLKSDR